jgi:hypothetical protein
MVAKPESQERGGREVVVQECQRLAKGSGAGEKDPATLSSLLRPASARATMMAQ